MHWIEWAGQNPWAPMVIPAALAILAVGLWTGRSGIGRQEAGRQPRIRRQRHRTSEPPVLAARAVSKGYRTPAGETVAVLQDVELEIPAHGLTALIGASGTGKSTLLNLFGGLDTPDGGEVQFCGEPLPGCEDEALRRYRARHVAFVFQELNLVTHLTAEQNVALPLLRQGLPRRAALARARDGLRALGMPSGLAGRRPAQLSGGERQRVAIARALVADADVVLADEPTGSLDPEHAEEVMQNLRRLVDERDVPVVMVTHNVELAGRYADLILELKSGGCVGRQQGERR